jgi:hypothetical protein
VIATFLQLDHFLAAVAALPAELLGLLKNFICCFIARAILRPVPFAIASTAYICFAVAAFSYLSAIP